MAAQKGVFRVTDNTNVANGIFYYLPLTELIIDVTVEKNEYQPGYLSEYAEQYLGEKTSIKSSVSFAISDIKIKTRLKADANELYFAVTSGAPFNIAFNSDQTIKSINIEQENAEQTSVKNAANTFKNNDHGYRFIKTSEKSDTIYTRQIVDSVLIEKRTIQKVYKKASKDEMAKEVAQKLAEIQNFKYSLLAYNEDDTYSAETIKLKLSELNKLEEAYLELFNGKNSTSKITKQYEFTPSSSGEFTLFLFDDLKGITNNVSNSEEVKIKINTADLARTVEKNTTGFVYRQPVNTAVSIISDNTVLKEVQLPILQLGQIKRLPSDDLSKIKIEFDAKNGTIKQLGFIGK